MSVPSKVENFKIESSDSCLIFSWTHLTNATGYYIYINNNSTNNTDNLIATISGSDIIPSLIRQVYIIGGQLNGYGAYYQIVGYNGSGIGAFSDNLLCKSYDGKNDINYDKLEKLTPRNLRNAVAWYDSADKSSTGLTFSNEIETINNSINSLYQITAANSSAASTKYKNISSSSNTYNQNITYSTNYYNGTYFYCPKGTYLTCNNLILEKSAAPESRVVIGIVYTPRSISGVTGDTNEVALWGTYNGTGSDRFQMIMSQNSRIEGNLNMPVGSSINSSSPTIYLSVRTCSSMSQIRVNGQTIYSFTESSSTEQSNTLQFNAVGDNSLGGDTLFHEMVVLKGPEWTMRDVYMLEGYFMNKWGLNANIISHPYKFIKPYLESTISPVFASPIAYTPEYLNGALVWYDANTSTITSSSINNKISSIYNMTLSNSPTLTNTSLSVTGSYINFTSSQFGTINNQLNLPRPNKYVVGLVFTPLSSDFVLWGTDNGGWDRFQGIGSFGGTNIFGNGNSNHGGNPSDNITVNELSNVINKPTIYVAVLTAGANSQIRVNGFSSTIGTTELNTFIEANVYQESNSFRINDLGNDTNGSKGNMRLHELVILGCDTWDMNDVYKLEGYFAHRWILDTNLPTEHPYKKNKPVVPNNMISDFPSAPNIRTIVQFQGGYKIYYIEPSNPGGIINSYKLYITDGTLVQTPISISQNPYTYNTSSTSRIKFRISAINSIGEGMLSEEKSIAYTSALFPSAPSINSVTLSSNTFTVVFTTPSSSSPIVSYNLYIQIGSQAQTSTNYIISNITNNTITYYMANIPFSTQIRFSLSAINSQGEGSINNPTIYITAAAPIPAPSTPATPTIGTVTSTSIAINWSTASNATSYRLEWSAGTATFNNTVSPLSTNPYTLTGLTASTTYYFRIVAINGTGSSTSISISQATSAPAPAPAPSTPATPTIGTVTSTSIAINWSTASNATSYRLEWSAGTATFNNTVSPLSANPYTLTGLTASTTYYFRIVAINGTGSSTSNSISQATSAPAPAPAPAPGLETFSYYRFITPTLITQNSNALLIEELEIYNNTTRYPPVALTLSNTISNGGDNSFKATINSEDYYITTSSTQHGLSGWNVFDRTTQRWCTTESGNAYPNGVASGNTKTIISTGATICGEWLQIQLPQGISITQLIIKIDSEDSGRYPKSFVVLGSNTGSSWTNIQYFNNITYDGLRQSILNITYTYSSSTSSTTPLSQTVLDKVTNWYDVADSGTLIYSGANISGITNKKLNTTNTLSITVSGGAIPTYSGTGSNASIQFTPNIYAYIPNYKLTRPKKCVVAIVFTPQQTSQPLWGNDNGGWDRLQGIGGWDGPAMFGNKDGYITINSLLTISLNVKYLYVAVLTAEAGSEIRVNKVASQINGGSTTFTESNSDTNGSDFFFFNAITNKFQGGNIRLHEIIILEGDTWTTSDVNDVENYLYTKWNINDVLPQSVIDKVTNWYDVADSGTLIYSGATISGIYNKKVGTSYALTIRQQWNVTYTGTGSSANIGFTSGSYATIVNYSLPRTNKYVVAIVFTPQETNKPLWGCDNGGWDRLQGIGSNWNGNAVFGNSSGSVTVNLLSNITTNKKYLYVAILTAGSGSEIRVNKVSSPINGGSTTFTESNNDDATNPFSFNTIGSNYDGSNILLHEIIILEGSTWTRSDAIAVETYLANKWGI
jgi:hypothetical protein